MSPFRYTAIAAMLLAWQHSLAAAQTAPKPAVPQVQSGRIVWWKDFAPARNVGVEDVWIWLPASYDTLPARRYPVLYMHDAENIFDRAAPIIAYSESGNVFPQHYDLVGRRFSIAVRGRF